MQTYLYINQTQEKISKGLRFFKTIHLPPDFFLAKNYEVFNKLRSDMRCKELVSKR